MEKDPEIAAAIATIREQIDRLKDDKSSLSESVGTLNRSMSELERSITKLYNRFMIIGASVLTLILTAAPDTIAALLKILGTFK